jgi:hexosaminidase
LASPEAGEPARYLARRFKELMGWKLGAKGTTWVRLSLEAVFSKNPEAYEFEVSKDGVLIRAATREGLLLGCQTLLQYCLQQRRSKSLRLPLQSIQDEPAFGWRGVLFDCCRHYFSVKSIKRVIDLLALHKFNRLHWHLTEDQGWRVEVKKYPRLAKVAAWRKHFDGPRYGGIYTHAQIKEVVRYAAEAGLMVVPEIEMPGHSTAALAAYPELACRPGTFKVRSEWGIFYDIYCAGNEKSFRFLEGVMDEVVKLFPAPWIHVGADEAPKERWRSCPKCQARIKKEGLKDEYALQTYFVGRMAKYLAKKGKTVVAWDEILEGGAPKGSVVQGWRGSGKGGPAYRASKAGRQSLVSPHSHWYLDHAHVGLKKSWSLEPMPQGLSKLEQSRVLGGECCVWTEGITDANLDERLFPRSLAVAERLWRGGGKAMNKYPEFQARAKKQVALLGKLGVKHSESQLKA